MRGYLTDEEEFRLADLHTGGAAKVTPPEYVHDYSELHMQRMVWTNEDKFVRLTKRGRAVAKAYCKKNGYT